MTEITASRTLVKSPPELWAECSDAESLARHLNGTFGEIRITRLEPETAVAWEGEQFSGTVRFEPSGWGTKVVMTAARTGAEVAEPAAAEPEPVREPASGSATEPQPGTVGAPKRGFLARLFGVARRAPGPPVEPQLPVPEPGLALEPVEPVVAEPDADLTSALDSLGQAHHRPFSRG